MGKVIFEFDDEKDSREIRNIINRDEFIFALDELINYRRKLKPSEEYQRRFNEAVDMQKPFTDNLSNVDKQVFDKIVESFITCEDQLLEDTFVYAVKYAYKVFKEIEN